MEVIKPYCFNVQGNINQVDIDNLIKLYNTVYQDDDKIVDSSTGEYFDILEISIEPGKDEKEILAEIDPLFLGYLILFMERYNILKVVFILKNHYLNNLNIKLSEADYQKSKRISDRAFSLYEQISFVSNFLKFGDRISLLAHWYKKETQEVLLVKRASLVSQRFFPTLIIRSEESIKEYFDHTYYKSPHVIAYFKKIEEVTNHLKKIKLDEFSSIEIFLLRLLLSEDNPSASPKNLTKDIIDYYIKYSYQLALGIKELALNIIEHSRISKELDVGQGVITGRIFERERLLALKGNEEREYLIKEMSSSFFIDLNVIDLGCIGIRRKYIENIKENWKNDIENKLSINYEQDIDTIKDKAHFTFDDFFIPNTKTEHQLNKLISRYGLQYFTHILTQRFDAFVKIISEDESLIFNGKHPDVKTSVLARSGTSYNCIIPFESFNTYYKKTKAKHSFDNIKSENSNLLLELYKHNASRKLSDDNYDANDLILFNEYPHGNETKYDLIKEIYFKLLKKNIAESILVFNAEYFDLNATDWLRLLSQISLEIKNIIIYNIQVEKTRELIDNRKIQGSNPLIQFWEEESCVLFYSYKTDTVTSYRRYGATVLTGKNENQFNYVNINIWKNHYSFHDLFINHSVQSHYFNPESKLFFEGNLKYFDLLIKNSDSYGSKISLFEISLQYALNKSLPDNLLKDTNNKGYKINDTHFRLGSKIHIESFYYAKRVFQNSFFTTPLAYLLTDYIYLYIKDYNESHEDERIFDITLIGYEDYSELLLSTSRSLLARRLGKQFSITHNTFSSKNSLSRPLESIQKNIFIIVPIASSFSTSIKIKNDLTYIFKRNDETNKKEFTFLEPHLNLILVGDEKFESKTENEVNHGFYTFNDSTLNDYGWQSIDKERKLVKLLEFSDTKEVVENSAPKSQVVLQKYFVPVYSKWNRADDCTKCFPENIINERCLIETGQASITPNLIFGLPKTKPNKSNNILDLTDSIYYGNLKKGSNRYLYYTRVGEVINKKVNNELKNFDLIKHWLEKLETKFGTTSFKNQKIVLVTPSSSTSSNFIDLVNEYVFNYTANCLTISLYEDYIENSESLYADGLHKADIVIYVDDVLSTTKSFLKINYIINYIRRKLGKGKGIDYCIVLINRMTYDSEENVLLKLAKLDRNIVDNLNKTGDQLLYFAKINNPSIEEPNGEFPLINEANRYRNLSDSASLDSIRSVFFEKYNKLQERDLLIKKDSLNIRNYVDDTQIYENKKLYQMLILDALLSLFEYDCPKANKGKSVEEQEMEYNDARSTKIDTYFLNKNDLINSDEYINKFRNLANAIRNEFFESEIEVKSKYKIYNKTLLRYDHNLDYIILKILCSTPIVYYKQLRESAFHWILAVLEKLRKGWEEHNIIGIDNLNNDNLIEYFKVDGNNYYTEYQKLKFLLKRSIQLKSNYLIHKDFLISIKRLINLTFENYVVLQKEKEKSEEVLVSKIKSLFNSRYLKGHIELYEYVKSLQRHLLLSKDRGDQLLSDLNVPLLINRYNSYQPLLPTGTIPFDCEDPNEQEFNNAFQEIKLLPKYRLISSKKLVYDIIALNKELIYQNEPKAIKLEKNIDQLSEEFTDNNGDFSHFLRLLKLENTSAIENFWNNLYDKFKSNKDGKIEFSDKNLINDISKDPRFKSIIPLIRIVKPNQHEEDMQSKQELLVLEKSFRPFVSFINLKAKLTNWEIDRTGKSFKDDTLEEEVKTILRYSSEILGESFQQCCLSVNYQYLRNPEIDDIFFFDIYRPNKLSKDMYSFNDKEKMIESLNYKMYTGITENYYDKHSLSNFEIIRNNNVISSRKNTNIEKIDDITNCPEFAGDSSDCNILLIKLSDFIYNFPHSFWKDDEKALVTQAVISFKLSQNTRINIKRLRLLLLLRGPLSKFINANILSNNMLEYINKKNTDRYQKKLGHRIDTFIRNQMNAYDDNNKEVVQILNEVISGQTKAYSINPTAPPKIIASRDLSKRIITLLESRHIFITNPISHVQRFISVDLKNEYKMHQYVYDIVLTELIINVRRHGTTIKPFVEITINENYLCIKNIQSKKINYYKDGQGLEMCREIIKKYDEKLDLIITPNIYDSNSERFNFIVKIPLFI